MGGGPISGPPKRPGGGGKTGEFPKPIILKGLYCIPWVFLPARLESFFFLVESLSSMTSLMMFERYSWTSLGSA